MTRVDLGATVAGAALPRHVTCAERFDDLAGVRLFPEEEAAMAHAVESRRREFATGRACARAAMSQLGLDPVAVPRGERGSATWPVGVTGSITHCAGYRAAAVAWARRVAALGIDAEPNEPLPEDVTPLVTTAAERDRLRLLPRGEVRWDRLLFSAKESVYKAWFPLTRRYLDFAEADVELHVAGDAVHHGAFTAHLAAPGPRVGPAVVQDLTGTWVLAHGLLATAVVLRRHPSRQAPSDAAAGLRTLCRRPPNCS